MNIAKNLHYLRKRDKITQEDLAEKLNVSRQSVSKWETGEAYPETEKLLAICDMFDVSLDGLMRGDLSEQCESAITETGARDDSSIAPPIESDKKDGATETTPKTEHKIFAEHINKFSRAMAIGVALILFGVAVCLALNGYSLTLSGTSAELTSIMSGVAVVVFTAGAVFLFVICGMRHDSFKKDNPIIAEPTDRVHRGFAATMAGLVSGILIDAVFLIVITSLIDAGIIKTPNKDMAYCYVTSAFMAVLAFIIGGLVYMGIQHSKYDMKEYNRDANQSQKDKIAEAVCGAIMLTATATFLMLGFIGKYWHPGWIVFPVGGIICGIVKIIFNAKK